MPMVLSLQEATWLATLIVTCLPTRATPTLRHQAPLLCVRVTHPLVWIIQDGFARQMT